MRRLKSLALLSLALMTLASVNAQPGGGMGGGGMGGPGGGMQQGGSMPVFNFTGSVGYFEIECDEVLKKLKLKKPSEAESAVEAAVASYNEAREALVISDRDAMDNIEFASSDMKDAMGDRDSMRTIMTKVGESCALIKPKMVEIHKQLVSSVTAVLDEKGLKKWEKYYGDLCEDNSFDPKAPVRMGRGGQGGGQGGEGRGGQGGGQGGMGGGQGGMGGGRPM